MTLALTNDGQIELCAQWTVQLYAVCHLYVNPVTPSIDTVLSDLMEASFPGYSPILIQGWTPPVAQGNKAVTFADAIKWTCTGAITEQLVYGYYVTRGTPGRLIWAELRLQGPIPISSAGQNVIVLPSLTLSP